MTDEPDRAKLEDLSARIRQASAARGTGSEADARPKQVSNGIGRLGADFVGAILGGAVFGWAVDRMFPVLKPWALIALIMLGFGVGVLNVWRGLAAPESED